MTPAEELELLLGPALWSGFSAEEVAWALSEADNVPLTAAALLCDLRGRQLLATGDVKKIAVDGGSVEMTAADWFGAATAFRNTLTGQDPGFFFEVV